MFRVPLAPFVLLLTAASAAAQVPPSARIPPRPVVPFAAFRRAVAAGTRTDRGVPGPGYWQQRVNYRIAATLDVRSGRLAGHETVTYVNHSPDTLPRLLFHIDQNIYAPGAQRDRRVTVTGGVTLSRVSVGGARVTPAPFGKGYYDYPTLTWIPLPHPLAPGDSVPVEIDWAYTVPSAPTFRSANLDSVVYAIGQWYPRAAVYDDVYGWDRTPYLGDGEFYLEYGDFDVTLTLPRGWLVGASGRLANATRVLAPGVRERLAAATRSDTVVHVVTPPMRGTSTTLGGPTTTWHFTAHDVRDFAWSTSRRYVWDAMRGPGGVLVQAFYRPEMRNWSQACRFGSQTLATMGHLVGPYRYPQLSITEGPIPGMEYPMVVFITAGRTAASLSSVIIHESSHQWFPMAVGSMEAKHPWMDEGFVTYWQAFTYADLWKRPVPAWGGTERYLRWAGTEREVPLMRHSDLVNPYGERTLAAYTKPAVVLGALRAIVGDSVFLHAFRDYYAAWSFKHPQPWDFFNAVERHARRALGWFWRPFFFETDVVDQAVGAVSADSVTIEDHGDAIVPAFVRFTLADGAVRNDTIPAKRWLTTRAIRLAAPAGFVQVVVDPDTLFPDVDRANNVWRR